MAFLIGLFRVVLTVAILESVLVDGNGHGASECEKWGNFHLQQIIQRGEKCVEMGATPTTGHELHNAKGIEDYRRFFVGYCQRESIVRDCLAEEATKFQVCQNENNFVNLFNGFQVYRGMLETLLDIECKSGDSSRLATFWHGINIAARDRKTSSEVKECYRRFHALMGDLEQSTIDNPSKSYVVYKEVEFFELCVHQIEMESQFKNVLHTFLTEIINRMKCINPQNGAFVVCNTIDVSSISSPSSCDARTNNNNISMYDVLESESLGDAFRFIIRRNEDTSNTNYISEFHEHVCSKDLHTKCSDLSKTYSVLCMNETQQQEFTVMCESFEQASNGLCVEGGNSLTEIITKVYILKNTSPDEDNAIYQCVDSVKSARKTNTIDDHSSKNMRFYHELETFKECLVNKFHDDQPFFDAVMSIYNNVRGKVKCVKPEDGTTALCREITH